MNSVVSYIPITNFKADEVYDSKDTFLKLADLYLNDREEFEKTGCSQEYLNDISRIIRTISSGDKPVISILPYKGEMIVIDSTEALTAYAVQGYTDVPVRTLDPNDPDVPTFISKKFLN